MTSHRNLGILIFPDVEVLDFCGPYEVFSVANRPLRDSTCYDPCALTDMVNSKDLLVLDSIVPAADDDIILMGDTSVAVLYRGKRVMEKIMYRPDGKNTRNLVLEDVAFIPCRFST